LLAKKGQQKSNQRLVVIDSIPLFHQTEGLSPMTEVALTQIETRAASVGMIIAGYYHANRLFKDTKVDVFSQRIADKIADLTGKSVLLTFDNKKLGQPLEHHALIGQISSHSSSNSESGKVWRKCPSASLKVDEDSLTLASNFIRDKVYKDLSDFDNHLDDITQDYLNVGLNIEIDRSSVN